MSQESFMQFLVAMRDEPARLAIYDGRNLSQLLFHAKSEGFDFSPEDVADVVGMIEANVILEKDHDPFDGTSRLWREMWGRRHLGYLVDSCVRRYSDQELRALIPSAGSGAA